MKITPSMMRNLCLLNLGFRESSSNERHYSLVASVCPRKVGAFQATNILSGNPLLKRGFKETVRHALFVRADHVRS